MAHSPQNFDRDFDQLCRSFEAIAGIRDNLKQQYALSRYAAWHGLTQSEMHRYFKTWLLRQVGGSSDA